MSGALFSLATYAVAVLHSKTIFSSEGMNCFRRHRYEVGAVVAIGAVVSCSPAAGVDVLQQLLLVNFIVLLVHRYEEYGWPGGEPATMNMALKPRTTPGPLSAKPELSHDHQRFGGVRLLSRPVFFPTVIWLGLAPVPFGIVQVVVHGIVTNVKPRSIYNPGLAGRT